MILDERIELQVPGNLMKVLLKTRAKIRRIKNGEVCVGCRHRLRMTQGEHCVGCMLPMFLTQ